MLIAEVLLHATVRLNRPLHADEDHPAIPAGTSGTIIQVFDHPGGIMVEFFDAEHRSLSLEPFTESQYRWFDLVDPVYG
jgi:hypothetical protein